MKSELTTPPVSGEIEASISERESCLSERGACLSTEIKTEDLKEDMERTTECEQQYLSKLKTSQNISCSEKMP